ncbi:MAG: radical SAM protein [Clostridia bacterium]|nr:radical SAM protein [Clostridia bacterium]MBQ8368772.1 radical SAM protein [Clostridia bacterium]
MEQQKVTPRGEPLWSSFIHAKGSRLGLPIAGNFELTNRCNFRCKMCYVHEDCEDGLTADEWIRLGETARDKGMVFLLLTGGEPFLRRDFREIYTALIDMGLLISINTNGSLIDDDMFEFLVKHPPLRMNISLYGTTADAYRNLCGSPSAKVVMHNITRLHKSGIAVKINSSVTPYNVEEIENIHAFAKELGVNVTATTYMYPPVRINGCQYGQSHARFDAEDAARYMLKCREQILSPEQLKNAADGVMPDDELCVSETGENMRCRAGKTAFWVTWDGRMLPCGMFPDDGWSIKDIGFDTAWENVRSYTRTVMMPRECTDCPKKNRCAACAAACIAETGRSDIKPEYICRMTKTYERLLDEKYNR